MAEAFWGAALGAFFTITVGWTLKTFAAWLAGEPEQDRANRQARSQRRLDRLEQPGIDIDLARERAAITRKFGPWTDRLRLWTQVQVGNAWQKCSPSHRWEAKQSAERSAELRRQLPGLFE